jgi:gliding motility associated protien GldN
MKPNFILPVLLLLLLSGSFASAQQTEMNNVLDGVYRKTIYKEKEIIPYDHIREADVFWSKRIWREIDVREKMNLYFKYPVEVNQQAQYFVSILLYAINNEGLTVYNTIDDQFTTAMPLEEVNAIGSRVDSQLTVNWETGEEEWVIVKQEFDPEKVNKFRIKEEWFFDEETSTMQVRIIGIAPLIDEYDESGNFRFTKPMFWVYYPDLRPILVHYEIFNPQNDAIRMSWEDVFEMRFFSSYITKESNVYDRRVQDYMPNGIDALLEAERIKNELFVREHDLWNY